MAGRAARTERINFNASTKQREQIIKLAKKEDLTITEFILKKCLSSDEMKPDNRIEIKELEIMYLKEKIDKLESDNQRLKDDHDDLKKQYNIAQSAIMWHSLPFYKKWGKRIELPYKE